MDRHVNWLRRRIIASVAKQSVLTFAVVTVVMIVLFLLLTGVGIIGVIFSSILIAQLVTLIRAVWSMQANPLNYSFMKKSVEQSFTHKVSRFQGVDDAHPIAFQLPGFAPVATIRDANGRIGPIFDVYHDPSRLVAASVSRSGALSLLSSLGQGRVLITDAHPVPPHERRVINVAEDDSVDAVIASHRLALSNRDDVVELDTSAHQVVLDSLALEYDSYVQLGPLWSSFLDLETKGSTFPRLTAQIKKAELVELPEAIGFDLSGPRIQTPKGDPLDLPEETRPELTHITYETQDASKVTAPEVVVTSDTGEPMVVPEVIAPKIEAPHVVAPVVTAPSIADKDVVVAPTAVTSAEAPLAEPPAELVSDLAVPVAEKVEVAAPSETAPSESGAVASSLPALTPVEDADAAASAPKIGPTPFITVEPDDIDDSAPIEPITAEVPAVVFTEAPAPAKSGAASGNGLPAEFGGSAAALTPRQTPANSPQLVRRVLKSLRSLGSGKAQEEPAPQPAAESPATLAEAMPVAPDSPASLADAALSNTSPTGAETPSVGRGASDEGTTPKAPPTGLAPAASVTTSAVTAATTASAAQVPVAHLTAPDPTSAAHVGSVTTVTANGAAVATVASSSPYNAMSTGAATARDRTSSAPIVSAALAPDPSVPKPRLSAVIKANKPAEASAGPAKRSRRSRRGK